MGLFTRSSYRCWHIRTLPANAQESMIKRVIAQHEKEAVSASYFKLHFRDRFSMYIYKKALDMRSSITHRHSFTGSQG